MIHQLRVYEIFEANKDAFHARFRDHAARIMVRYGFEFLSMWQCRTEHRLEFVYLLSWPDEATMKSAWRAFMADEEWQRVKAETGRAHGTMVGEIEDRQLVSVNYGPRPKRDE